MGTESLYQKGQIEVEYGPTHEMVADILTKPLVKEQFEYLCEKLNLYFFSVGI